MKEKIPFAITVPGTFQSCVWAPVLLLPDMYCSPTWKTILHVFLMYVLQFPASLLIRHCSFWMRKNRSGTHRTAAEASGILFSASFENPGYLCLYTAVSGKSEKALSGWTSDPGSNFHDAGWGQYYTSDREHSAERTSCGIKPYSGSNNYGSSDPVCGNWSWDCMCDPWFCKKELEEGTLVEVPVGFSFPLREIGFVCRQKDTDSALIAPFFDDETGHPDK